MRDPYSVLGVDRKATDDDIRQAYLRMVRLVHPNRFDPHKQPREWRDANSLLVAVNEAYGRIRSHEARAAFDRQQRQKEPDRTSGHGTSEEGVPKPRSTAGSAPVLPTHGSCTFQSLPERSRTQILRRQSGRIPGQASAPTELAGSRFLVSGLCMAWFPFLTLNLAPGLRWELWTIVWTCTVTACVGVLLGFQVSWLVRRFRSTLQPRVYVTPLYVIQTTFDEVAWWPIWTLRDVKATHHYSNGSYQHTAIVFDFDSSRVELQLSPLGSAEEILTAVDRHGKRCAEAATAGNWSYFVTNDDFRGVHNVGKHGGPPTRRTGLPTVIAVACAALALFAVTLAWNATLPSRTGSPPVERRLPKPISAAPAERRVSDVDKVPELGATQASFAALPQALPRNGSVSRYSRREAVAPLTIQTRGSEHHYFIKLVDYLTDEPIVTVFVRGGSSVDIDVPLGAMKLRYAVGTTWYGDQLLFGPDTEYAEADARFDFSESFGRVSGYAVELFLQPNGNLREREIRPDEW